MAKNKEKALDRNNKGIIRCECELKGVLYPQMISFYDPTTELPYVKHKPNKCKCTNELKRYIRNGKIVWLCSCCKLLGDMEYRRNKGEKQ